VTPERWRQIRDLFERVGKLEASVREKAICDACPGDDELRRTIDRMVASERAPEDFLACLVREASDDCGEEESEGSDDASLGDAFPRIDRYRIRRRIGDGGMGVVYAAIRSDGLMSNEVALKVLRRGLDTESFVRRFHAERAVLERLDHPNIARLLDAGTCDDGRPYLVMELVDGVRIDRWREGRMSSGEIVELFVQVCDAVSYAHSRLVIHRDLKPSNILVTNEGIVKLLDFGIAKMLDEDLASGGETRTADRVLTPRYASPEQLRGEPVSTASDVYSMGVLLYESLTGRLPYVTADGSAAAHIAAIREQTPPRASEAARTTGRPSHEVTPIVRSLRGDLDIILDQALRQDPSRRYRSATAMGDDLRAFLGSRPISARPESLAYELKKLVRRHPWQSIGTGAAIVAILGISVVAIAFARAARESETRSAEALASAQKHEAVAERFGEFLTQEFLLLLDPARSMNGAISLEDAIRQAAGRIEGRFPDSPLAEALIEHTVGDAFIQRTRYADAEGHLRRAWQLRETHLGSDHLDTLIAKRDLGTCCMWLGRLDEAKLLLEEVLATQVRTLSVDDGLTLLSKSMLGQVLSRAGDFERAERLFRESFDGRMRTLGPKDGNTQSSMNQLGVFLMQRGKLADALPLFVQAEELRRSEFGVDHPRTLIARANLATLRGRMGEVDRALADLEAVRVDQLRVLGPTHGHTVHVLGQLANLYGEHGDDERSLTAHQARIEAFVARHGPESIEVCDVRVTVAEVFLRLGRAEEAQQEVEIVRHALAACAERGVEVPAPLSSRLQAIGSTDR
jgi:eukaryotic-like serine/threonine-protein kinase